MNPKLTITVDGKNRATAVMEGVVSVGAKVDVVLKGLTSDIPLWGDDDGFVGYSLRFRIVDECGHDLVRYPLEELDQWNSTSTGVYESATAVDFDTDALRHIFEGVVFNDSLEFGVVLDSVVDAAEYGTGRLKIQQWAVASTEDPTVLPDWRETLAKLQEDLENIETAQSAAELARDEAVSAASSAAASATVSASSATAAETAQNSARASELNAAESEAEAGNAADAAEAARDAAEIAEASAISAAASAVGSATSAAESAKEAAESAIAAGKVKSVNGKIGEVVLVASDVGAYSKTETNSKLAAKADLVDGVVPASQLPSYVDDVLEFASVAAFPSTGESGKIYVATDTNLTYRWGGSQYVEISQSLALGETALTAYAGDKGKKVTDDLAAHKADTENPHAVTAAQVGAYTKAEVDEKIGEGGKVQSVNGKDGVVVLTADDVGALPATKDETTGEYKVAEAAVFKKKVTIELDETDEEESTESESGIGIAAFDSTTERGVEIYDETANKSSALVPDGTPFVTMGTIKEAAYQFPTFSNDDTIKTIIAKLQQIISLLQGIGD